MWRQRCPNLQYITTYLLKYQSEWEDIHFGIILFISQDFWSHIFTCIILTIASWYERQKKLRENVNINIAHILVAINKVHLQALPGEVTALSSLTFLLHFSILHRSKSATFRCPVSSLNMLLLSYTMGTGSFFKKPGI